MRPIWSLCCSSRGPHTFSTSHVAVDSDMAGPGAVTLVTAQIQGPKLMFVSHNLLLRCDKQTQNHRFSEFLIFMLLCLRHCTRRRLESNWIVSGEMWRTIEYPISFVHKSTKYDGGHVKL